MKWCHDRLKQFVKSTSLRFLSTCFKRNHNSEIKLLFDVSCMLLKGHAIATINDCDHCDILRRLRNEWVSRVMRMNNTQNW